MVTSSTSSALADGSCDQFQSSTSTPISEDLVSENKTEGCEGNMIGYYF